MIKKMKSKLKHCNPHSTHLHLHSSLIKYKQQLITEHFIAYSSFTDHQNENQSCNGNKIQFSIFLNACEKNYNNSVSTQSNRIQRRIHKIKSFNQSSLKPFYNQKSSTAENKTTSTTFLSKKKSTKKTQKKGPPP